MKKVKRFIIKVLAPFRRIGLKNTDYTIISNNCWGGVISRNFGLAYKSPTCGTYFFAKEFLSFCKDLPASLKAPLTQISVDESKY